MNKEDTLKQICKMISSGDIPKVVYDKYLSKTPLGFMNYEELYDFLNEQNQKYKEAIDKAIKFINYNEKYKNGDECFQFVDIESEILYPLEYILFQYKDYSNAYLDEFEEWIKEVE